MAQRSLIIMLALLGAVSVASGLAGIVLGPASVPGGAPTSATVDSEYRFTNVFWLSAGIALWWSLFRLHERKQVTRIVLAIAFLGGCARVISIVATGWPHPIFIGTLALELIAVPLIIWWHARVVDEPGTENVAETGPFPARHPPNR